MALVRLLAMLTGVGEWRTDVESSNAAHSHAKLVKKYSWLSNDSPSPLAHKRKKICILVKLYIGLPITVVAGVLYGVLCRSGDIETNPGPKFDLTSNSLGKVLNLLWNARTKWFNLGLGLGIDQETLKMLKRNYPNEDDCFREMLSEWLKTIDPTWEELIAALTQPSVGCEHVAAKVRKEQGIPEQKPNGDAPGQQLQQQGRLSYGVPYQSSVSGVGPYDSQNAPPWGDVSRQSQGGPPHSSGAGVPSGHAPCADSSQVSAPHGHPHQSQVSSQHSMPPDGHSSSVLSSPHLPRHVPTASSSSSSDSATPSGGHGGMTIMRDEDVGFLMGYLCQHSYKNDDNERRRCRISDGLPLQAFIQVGMGMTIMRDEDVGFLMGYLCKHSYKWEVIGTALHFLPGELENIRHSPQVITPQQRLNAVLCQWVQWPTTAHSQTPTMEMLRDALHSDLVGLGAVANQLYDARKYLPSQLDF